MKKQNKNDIEKRKFACLRAMIKGALDAAKFGNENLAEIAGYLDVANDYVKEIKALKK